MIEFSVLESGSVVMGADVSGHNVVFESPGINRAKKKLDAILSRTKRIEGMKLCQEVETDKQTPRTGGRIVRDESVSHSQLGSITLPSDDVIVNREEILKHLL